MFINKTIGELLFDGYDDPVLEIGASFDEEEKKLPMEKFGWFYKVVYVLFFNQFYMLNFPNLKSTIFF